MHLAGQLVIFQVRDGAVFDCRVHHRMRADHVVHGWCPNHAGWDAVRPEAVDDVCSAALPVDHDLCPPVLVLQQVVHDPLHAVAHGAHALAGSQLDVDLLRPAALPASPGDAHRCSVDTEPDGRAPLQTRRNLPGWDFQFAPPACVDRSLDVFSVPQSESFTPEIIHRPEQFLHAQDSCFARAVRERRVGFCYLIPIQFAALPQRGVSPIVRAELHIQRVLVTA